MNFRKRFLRLSLEEELNEEEEAPRTEMRSDEEILDYGKDEEQQVEEVTEDEETEPETTDTEEEPVQEQPQAEPKVIAASPATQVINKNTIVISAFPGCGKSTYAQKHDDSKDLEMCMYSKGVDGREDPHFPLNYISMIKWHLINCNWKYLFIACHEDIREALDKEGIKYYIFYPEVSRKDEFLEMYRKRGSNQEFINLMETNWENWMNGMAELKNAYPLAAGEFISDELFTNKYKFLKQ